VMAVVVILHDPPLDFDSGIGFECPAWPHGYALVDWLEAKMSPLVKHPIAMQLYLSIHSIQVNALHLDEAISSNQQGNGAGSCLIHP
jgi:hypothetical protein